LGEAYDAIQADSEAIVRAKQLASRVASFADVPVLLLGETGTGKELFAAAIHQASPRSKKPFYALNCASIPAELLESQLFGHVKGSFTGAVVDREGAVAKAEGGTIFLDEIGEMPIHLQPKLLRFLQEKEYERVGESKVSKANVRTIAATNVDLEAAVAAREFRADLLYRINAVTIQLPPLRNRGRDDVESAKKLLQDFNRQYDTAKVFTDEALRALAARPWWGNFRELQNAVVRTWRFRCITVMTRLRSNSDDRARRHFWKLELPARHNRWCWRPGPATARSLRTKFE
jgi:NtrC-family two-component system response regulator AlgB